jgi:hypothetical protein
MIDYTQWTKKQLIAEYLKLHSVAPYKEENREEENWANWTMGAMAGLALRDLVAVDAELRRRYDLTLFDAEMKMPGYDFEGMLKEGRGLISRDLSSATKPLI